MNLDLVGEFPELNFFVVTTENRNKYLFASYETSLALRHAITCVGKVIEIDILCKNKPYDYTWISSEFKKFGMYFAETDCHYWITQLETLKEDILITKLAGVCQ